MLEPEYKRRVAERSEDLASLLHEEIIKVVVEGIVTRMERGVDYRLTARDKWLLETLQAAGYLREALEREIAAKTKLMLKEIRAAFDDAAVRNMAWDDAVYAAAGLKPPPLRQSPYLLRLVERGYKKTAGEWVNFTGTLADAAQQLYIRECDKAYHLTASGAMSQAQVVRQAVDTVAKEGVIVKYTRQRADGTRYVYHTDTIETATARAVRTGVGQACGEMTLARMEEMGWDIVLVSAHLGARTGDGGENFANHYWWQGKFYRRDVTVETIRQAMNSSGRSQQADIMPGGAGLPLTGESGTVQTGVRTGAGASKFPPLSVCGIGDVQGLLGANCRHSIGPGDGRFNPYEGLYDSEENRIREEQEQKQRKLERAIRKTKREVQGAKAAMDAATDPETKAELKADYQKKALKLQEQNKAYRAYCDETGLKTQDERLHVAGWDRKQAAAASGAARSAAKAAELTTPQKTAIIDKKVQPGEKPDVHTVGHIDKRIFQVVTEDIRTDEVIITDERIAHIKARHPGAYEQFGGRIKDIVEMPDYILEANRPDSALILKEFEDDGGTTKTVLRLATSKDNPSYKNSIMTLVKIDRSDWNRLVKNKKILYRRDKK